MAQSDSSRDTKGNFEKIGEGVGGLAGQAADAGMNLLNNLFGAAGGSMGGGWSQASRERDSSSSFGEAEDRRCRSHFEATPRHDAGSERSYDRVRPLYQFGHLAGQNPDYQNRSFEEIEPELRREWGEEQDRRFGTWPEVRGYVDFGYTQQAEHGSGRESE